jgi:hypothetical protein
VAHEQHVGLEALELVARTGGGRLAAGLEVEELLAVRLHDERRPRRLAPQEPDAGEARLGKRTLAGTKVERLDRFEELTDRVRGRKALQQQRGVKRQAADLAKAADQPEKVPLRKRLRAHSLSLPGSYVT